MNANSTTKYKNAERDMKNKFQIQTHPFGQQFCENKLKLNFGNLKLWSDNL